MIYAGTWNSLPIRWIGSTGWRFTIWVILILNKKNYNGALNWFTRFVDRGTVNDRAVQADAYNRIGDCNFYARRFDSARQDYARAVEIDPSLGDYSLYQEAFVRGLQKDYTGKIQILNRLIAGLSPSLNIWMMLCMSKAVLLFKWRIIRMLLIVSIFCWRNSRKAIWPVERLTK